MSLMLWEFILSHTENQEKWFWTLAGRDVILPISRSMGWKFVHGDNHGCGAIPFNGLYSCSHVPIGKSAQLSNTGKSLHWLLPRLRWAYQWSLDKGMSLWLSSAFLKVLCPRDRSALLPLSFFFWKAHLKQASGRTGRPSSPCLLTFGVWKLWKSSNISFT